MNAPMTRQRVGGRKRVSHALVKPTSNAECLLIKKRCQGIGGFVALCHGLGACGCAGRETRIATLDSQETLFVQHFVLQTCKSAASRSPAALNCVTPFRTLSIHSSLLLVRIRTTKTSPFPSPYNEGASQNTRPPRRTTHSA